MAVRRRGALLSLLASLVAVSPSAAEAADGGMPAVETDVLAAEAPTAVTTTSKAREDAPPGIGPVARPRGKTGTALICDLIATNAAATKMSPDFFARLIWKESRFDGEALSPVGARGIAQFMPGTARERGLDDPYDIAEAIRHSALYLRDLKADLGNWGLAAAAYNGGINRVKRWQVTGGSLPYETEDYVLSITARSADWFLEPGREIEAAPLDEAKSFDESCRAMPMVRTRAPAIESAPMQPWGVQVAGSPRQAVAMQSFRRVQARFSGILGGKAPIVVRDRASRGRIYAVRIGADSRGEADTLCSRLRGAGGSCVVFRN